MLAKRQPFSERLPSPWACSRDSGVASPFQRANDKSSTDSVLLLMLLGSAPAYNVCKKRSNSAAADANASTLKTPKANRENASNDILPTSNQNVKKIFGFEIYEGAVVNDDLLEELSIHDPDAAVDKNGNISEK